jgi:hypothetical protein
MYRLILLLLISSSFICECRAQNILNPKPLVKKLKVKSLLITTDSNQMGCPVDYYEYDRNGNRTYHAWSTTEDRTVTVWLDTLEVYSAHFFEGDNENKIILDTTFYYYNSDKSLKFCVVKNCRDSIYFDTLQPIHLFIKRKRLDNPVYNSSKQLISHTFNGINRPCLTPSKGIHTFKYSYFKNGLIKKVDIYTPAEKKYMTWYYLYEEKEKYRGNK